ncbi:hypothetical protein TNCV_4364181 [Trichonephila clavipes]|nr:hypothetical protein TNCV_4364181 [Trichonephila clavipes]
MTLLNSKGKFTTCISSIFVGRRTKVCTWPSDSLAAYWGRSNNGSLWSFSKAPAAKDSSQHLVSSNHVATKFLKKFSAILQGISLLSQTCLVNCPTMGLSLVYYDYRHTGVVGQRSNNG